MILRSRRGDHTTARTRSERGRSQPTRHPPLVTRDRQPKIHAIPAGRLRANTTTVRGTGPSSLFRRRENFESPVLAYVIERPVPSAIIEGEQVLFEHPAHGRMIPQQEVLHDQAN
jgi:hypothetical protein